MSKNTNPTEPSQVQKFKDAARELGCDEDESTFEERLRRLAKTKPKSADKNGK